MAFPSKSRFNLVQTEVTQHGRFVHRRPALFSISTTSMLSEMAYYRLKIVAAIVRKAKDHRGIIREASSFLRCEADHTRMTTFAIDGKLQNLRLNT